MRNGWIRLFQCVGVCLILVSSAQIANAAYSCEHALSWCYLHCTEEPSYNSCATQCEMNYNYCNYGGDPSDVFPQPLPVEDDSRSICMSACQSCQDIPDPFDRLTCSMGCYSYCNENYPKS